MRWFGHIHRMKEERNVRRIYETRTQGKNQKGRPRKEWKDDIRREIRRMDITWEEAKQLTQDRKKWREKYSRNTPYTINVDRQL